MVGNLGELGPTSSLPGAKEMREGQCKTDGHAESCHPHEASLFVGDQQIE